MEKNYVKSTGDWDKIVRDFQLNDYTISEELAMQLLTGTVDEKRYINYDKYWSEKLDRLNSRHTSKYNLHIDEVEKSLANVSQYLNNKRCPVNYNEVIDCFKIFKNHEILICNDEVEKFIKSVDKFMYKIIRPNSERDSLWKKRLTYTELFNNSYF